MELLKLLNNRYSTKEFDPTKKISDENLESIKDLLQLAPSSTNAQPWHFVLATSEEGKQRISKGAQGFFSFNEKKILDASAVVVFAARNDISDEFLSSVLEKEDEDGRYSSPERKNETDKARKIFVNIHKNEIKDAKHWAEKQVYLNLGHFLLGLSHLGIDSIPMEGLDMKVLDEEFGLPEKGYSSTLVVALGYRGENDFNANLPKSRLAKEDIIAHI